MAWNMAQNIRNASYWLARKIELIELKEHQKINSINPSILRGGIFNVELGNGNVGGEKNKTRPCMVLSKNGLNNGDTVVIVPLTTKFKCNIKNGRKIPRYPNHYIIYKSNYHFLDDDSCIKFEDIRAIDKVRVGNHLGNIDPADMKLMENRLLNAMGF